MRFCIYLNLVFFALPLQAHPLHNEAIDIKEVNSTSLEKVNGEIRYKFSLVHNDFARPLGRKYDLYSPYDRQYIEENSFAILKVIGEKIQLKSQNGLCTLSQLSAEATDTVRINAYLQAPSQYLVAVFHCPGKLKLIKNRLYHKMAFKTLEKIRLQCPETIDLSLDHHGELRLPSNCQL